MLAVVMSHFVDLLLLAAAMHRLLEALMELEPLDAEDDMLHCMAAIVTL